jgi:hypothetical protein
MFPSGFPDQHLDQVLRQYGHINMAGYQYARTVMYRNRVHAAIMPNPPALNRKVRAAAAEPWARFVSPPRPGWLTLRRLESIEHRDQNPAPRNITVDCYTESRC